MTSEGFLQLLYLLLPWHSTIIILTATLLTIQGMRVGRELRELPAVKGFGARFALHRNFLGVFSAQHNVPLD